MHSRAPENEVRPVGGPLRPYVGHLFFFSNELFFAKLFMYPLVSGRRLRNAHSARMNFLLFSPPVSLFTLTKSLR